MSGPVTMKFTALHLLNSSRQFWGRGPVTRTRTCTGTGSLQIYFCNIYALKVIVKICMSFPLIGERLGLMCVSSSSSRKQLLPDQISNIYHSKYFLTMKWQCCAKISMKLCNLPPICILNCSKVAESNNSDVRGFIWSSWALHNFLRCPVFRTISPLNHHEFGKW